MLLAVLMCKHDLQFSIMLEILILTSGEFFSINCQYLWFLENTSAMLVVRLFLYFRAYLLFTFSVYIC